MNLLKRLFGIGQTGSAGDRADANALFCYVRGHKCGAVTRVRIDKRNDLSRDDDDNLFVRKVIVDSKCFGQVEIELRFDNAYREIGREIRGGEFVARDVWQAAQVSNTQP
jgi:hypothetical protein